MSTAQPDADAREQERRALLDKVVYRRHERVNPCFMTGKGCIFTDRIDEPRTLVALVAALERQ